MLDAHDRLRASGIKPNTPDLPGTFAGVNELNLIACEKSLRDAGDDEETIDRKMLHVILVADAEAVREEHLDWFKPALIFDLSRFNRAVDTTLEEVSRSRRKGPLPGASIGPCEPQRGHGTTSEPFSKGLV